MTNAIPGRQRDQRRWPLSPQDNLPVRVRAVDKDGQQTGSVTEITAPNTL